VTPDWSISLGRLDEMLGSVGEVHYGCNLVVLEDITDVKVEVS
jgi:hypothetical protein